MQKLPWRKENSPHRPKPAAPNESRPPPPSVRPSDPGRRSLDLPPQEQMGPFFSLASSLKAQFLTPTPPHIFYPTHCHTNMTDVGLLQDLSPSFTCDIFQFVHPPLPLIRLTFTVIFSINLKLKQLVPAEHSLWIRNPSFDPVGISVYYTERWLWTLCVCVHAHVCVHAPATSACVSSLMTAF